MWNALLDTTKHRNGEQNLPIPTDIGQSTFLNDVTLDDVKNTVKIFKEMTGKTHGIKFKIKPPKKAKIIAKKGDKFKRLDFFGIAVSN